MSLVDTILAEFDNEMALTRRVLERAPGSAFTWRPHDKSWTLGELCTHLTNLLHWGNQILTRDGYDIVTDATPKSPALDSPASVLAAFDGRVSEVRARFTGMIDAELSTPWVLTRNGTVLMSTPRIAAFKQFTLNHLVHHRGQLSVYLRLQNVPLPPLYGPTADEAL